MSDPLKDFDPGKIIQENNERIRREDAQFFALAVPFMTIVTIICLCCARYDQPESKPCQCRPACSQTVGEP